MYLLTFNFKVSTDFGLVLLLDFVVVPLLAFLIVMFFALVVVFVFFIYLSGCSFVVCVYLLAFNFKISTDFGIVLLHDFVVVHLLENFIAMFFALVVVLVFCFYLSVFFCCSCVFVSL